MISKLMCIVTCGLSRYLVNGYDKYYKWFGHENITKSALAKSHNCRQAIVANHINVNIDLLIATNTRLFDG